MPPRGAPVNTRPSPPLSDRLGRSRSRAGGSTLVPLLPVRRGTTVLGMFRWLFVLVTGGVLTGFTLLLVTGRYINDGPVVVSLTRNHGLHAGDLFVVAGWAVGIAALLALALLPVRGEGARPRSGLAPDA